MYNKSLNISDNYLLNNCSQCFRFKESIFNLQQSQRKVRYHLHTLARKNYCISCTIIMFKFKLDIHNGMCDFDKSNSLLFDKEVNYLIILLTRLISKIVWIGTITLLIIRKMINVLGENCI